MYLKVQTDRGCKWGICTKLFVFLKISYSWLFRFEFYLSRDYDTSLKVKKNRQLYLNFTRALMCVCTVLSFYILNVAKRNWNIMIKQHNRTATIRCPYYVHNCFAIVMRTLTPNKTPGIQNYRLQSSSSLYE